MSEQPPCPRAWEAEAIEDGRLDSRARASFERHLTSCETCRAESLALARIAEAMKELPEHAMATMDRRRARIALLQRANVEILRGRGSWGARAFAAAMVCMVAVAFAVSRLVAFPSTGRTTALAPAIVAAPAFEIVDVGQAAWTKSVAGGVVHVTLAQGKAAIHVEHLAPEQRFLVDLPDGDLEVRGTRFQVDVFDNRTKHVEVSEGVVALRLRGTPEVVLRAGDAWNAPREPVATAAMELPQARAVSQRHSASTTSTSATRPTGATRAGSGEPAPSADVQSEPEKTAAPTPVVGAAASDGDGFATAVHLVETGNCAAADSLLAAFVRDHPNDARSEDAAFLRAACRVKIGDSAGASRLSREYLGRYPQGLRRREAERMITGD